MSAPRRPPAPLPSRRARWLLAAAFLPVSLVSASDPPKLKEGLWQVRDRSTEKPGGKVTESTFKICRDHAYDKAANAKVKDVNGCKTVVNDLGGGKISSASTCAIAGMTIVSAGLADYKSDTATHSETHATYSPPYKGKAEESATQDQQYLGACPAGMKPGDTVGPDGLIRHHER